MADEKKEEKTLEEAFSELDVLAGRLEDRETSLEDSFRLYKQGMELLKYCNKIEVLDYYVYKVGFYINDYSYSITLGMLKSILGIVLLFTANALSKKIRGESIV